MFECIRAVHPGLVSFVVPWMGSGQWLGWHNTNTTVEGGGLNWEGADVSAESTKVMSADNLDGVSHRRLSGKRPCLRRS